MKIGIANDHTSIELKNIILNYVKELCYEIIDYGISKEETVDYPIYGKLIGNKIIKKEIDLGILICGTGVGITLAANKIKGIRAVVCSEPYTAKLSKMHNNTNILGFGSRVVGSELAKMIVKEWLDAKFEGGRHQKRVDLIE